jgi:hypothetical protein
MGPAADLFRFLIIFLRQRGKVRKIKRKRKRRKAGE